MQTRESVMKIIILISLFILFGCGDTYKSTDKDSRKVNELVGAYIFEKPLEPSVMILNNDNSWSMHTIERSGWSENSGKWNIKNNELCIDDFKSKTRCMEYEINGSRLLIYDNPGNRPDIAKKIQ